MQIRGHTVIDDERVVDLTARKEFIHRVVTSHTKETLLGRVHTEDSVVSLLVELFNSASQNVLIFQETTHPLLDHPVVILAAKNFLNRSPTAKFSLMGARKLMVIRGSWTPHLLDDLSDADTFTLVDGKERDLPRVRFAVVDTLSWWWNDFGDDPACLEGTYRFRSWKAAMKLQHLFQNLVLDF